MMVRKHECPFRGDIKEVKLEYMLHQDKRLDFDQIIDEIPAWDYESPNPPIGARSAIEIADRFSRTYLPADEGMENRIDQPLHGRHSQFQVVLVD